MSIAKSVKAIRVKGLKMVAGKGEEFRVSEMVLARAERALQSGKL